MRGRDSRVSATCVQRPAGTGAGGGAGRRETLPWSRTRSTRRVFFTGGTDTRDPRSTRVSAGGTGPDTPVAAGADSAGRPSTPAHGKDGAGPGPRPGTSPATLERACCPMPCSHPPATSGHATSDLRTASLAKSPGRAPTRLAAPCHRWSCYRCPRDPTEGGRPDPHRVRPGRRPGHHLSLPIVTHVSSPH